VRDWVLRSRLDPDRRRLVARVRARALRLLAGPDAALTYAQEGEDRILLRIFEARGVGFYVDVGAHHPTRFSNTHLLYLDGWRGINIDAMPGSMRAFDKARPDDVNLEMGVAEALGTLRYHMFNEPALNSFSAEVAQAHEEDPRFRVVRTVELPVMPLAAILERHAPQGVKIDLLSVDVEGLDLEVLRSNNWGRHRPTVVCVEAWHEGDGHLATDEFLRAQGYVPAARTHNTQLYQVERGVH